MLQYLILYINVVHIFNISLSKNCLMLRALLASYFLCIHCLLLVLESPWTIVIVLFLHYISLGLLKGLLGSMFLIT